MTKFLSNETLNMIAGGNRLTVFECAHGAKVGRNFHQYVTHTGMTSALMEAGEDGMDKVTMRTNDVMSLLVIAEAFPAELGSVQSILDTIGRNSGQMAYRGYVMTFNPLWNTIQVNHAGSGYAGEFSHVADAIEVMMFG